MTDKQILEKFEKKFGYLYQAVKKANGKFIYVCQTGAVKNFISAELQKQKQEIETKVWKGADEWSKNAWRLNWLKKKKWYDEQELSSSIANYIIKELKK